MNSMVKNIEFSKVSNESSVYWNELGINIEFLNETKFKYIDDYFSNEIKKLKAVDIEELSNFFVGEKVQINSAEDLIKNVTSEEKKRLFLLLKEFTLRKKRSIKEFVEQNLKNIEYSSQLAQIWLMYQNAPGQFFEIVTYHNWGSRSSDTVYTYKTNALKKSIPRTTLLKIAKEKGFRDTLQDILHNKSGKAHTYKMYSYALVGENQIIFQLYKKVNDKTVPDFEKPVRNREVKSIMFLMDCQKKTLEIRDYNQGEKYGVLEYLSSNLQIECTEIKKDVFLGYNWKELKDSFLGKDTTEGEMNSEDALNVSAITFKRSTLVQTPQVHFELEHGDVMSAVNQAHEKGVIDLRNLIDIKNIKLKVFGKSRTIRTVAMDNGDVIFTMDDGNLSQEIKESIEMKFKEKFGIPLEQPISNLYFDEGVETKTDYLMGLNTEEKFDDVTKIKFDELIQEGLLEYYSKEELTCKQCGEFFSESIEECPECEIKLRRQKRNYLKVNESKTRKDFELKLKAYLEKSKVWTKLSTGNVTIEDEKYECINLINEDTDEVMRFWLTFKQLPNKVINRIQRICTPTVIVYVAANNINIERYSYGCVLTKNFGFFYMFHEEKFKNYMEELEMNFRQRAKLYTSQSAYKAYESLKGFIQNAAQYNDKVFEDDVYAIINDISLNNVKWGARFSGKIVPEGIFTLSYKINGEEGRAVFSYDCKFSRRKEGYDLKIDEHRKAAQYLKIGSRSDFLTNYLGKEKIYTHIIISNNIKVEKIKAMNKHLQGEKIPPVAKLLKADAFIRLYELYLEHFKDLHAKPNYFKKYVIELLGQPEKDEITIGDIELKFKKLLKPGLIEQNYLDMKEVSDDFVNN